MKSKFALFAKIFTVMCYGIGVTVGVLVFDCKSVAVGVGEALDVGVNVTVNVGVIVSATSVGDGVLVGV